MRNIIETIRKYDMIREGTHVLAGVSGGADSVCLLAALLEFQRECPFELTVVHVEHGIRGEESRQDAEFVRKLCEELGTDCQIVHGDAPAEARARGISIEEAARALRYRIFEEVRAETGADVIAVAHNENDQAETVLWNLIRGSALKGLGGIRPVRDHIIRPLLFTPRARIEQILAERALPWRTDRTNLDVDYTRNRLRLEVLPYLSRHLNEKAAEHIAGAAERLQEAQRFIERLTERAAERCIADETKGAGTRVFLKLKPFEQEEEYLQGELLRECVGRCAGLKDVGKIHIGMLRELAKMPCGKRMDLPGGVTASRRDGAILFEKTEKENHPVRGGRRGDAETENGRDAAEGDIRRGDAGTENGRDAAEGDIRRGTGGAECEEYLLDLNGQLEIGDMTVTAQVILRELFDENLLILNKRWEKENARAARSGGKTGDQDEILSEKKYTKWLSCDTIKSNVYCRKRKTGDYLTVNVQGGRKKLKDYMIDCKIPREERDAIWLFADGSHVLWIPGFRISEAAKVTDETKKILEITVILRRNPCAGS